VLANTHVHQYTRIRNTETTTHDSLATREQGQLAYSTRTSSRIQSSISEEGAGAALPVEQLQRSEQHLSFDDRVSLKFATEPETGDGVIEETTRDGRLQRAAVGCQQIDGIVGLDGIHASGHVIGSSTNINLVEPGGESIDLDRQARHTAEYLKESAKCAADGAEIGHDGTRYVHELLQMPGSFEETSKPELPASILERRMNIDESSLRKDSDTAGQPGSVAARSAMVEEGLDRKTPNIRKNTLAIGGCTDGSPGGGASISTKQRKSKFGKKDPQTADPKPGERGGARGGVSDKGKEHESDVSHTDPFVLPTVHRRPVAEPYRAIEISRGIQVIWF